MTSSMWRTERAQAERTQREQRIATAAALLAHDETSVTEIADSLRAAAASPTLPEHAPARPGEQRRSCLDPSRAGRVLGWRPGVPLRNGLAATYDFFKKETKQ